MGQLPPIHRSNLSSTGQHVFMVQVRGTDKKTSNTPQSPDYVKWHFALLLNTQASSSEPQCRKQGSVLSHQAHTAPLGPQRGQWWSGKNLGFGRSQVYVGNLKLMQGKSLLACMTLLVPVNASIIQVKARDCSECSVQTDSPSPQTL